MFPGRISSLTHFMAIEGAMKRLTKSTPRPGTTADIPDTFAAMLPYVRQMAGALVDRTDIIDGANSKPVKAVKSTSGTVYEHEAWNLMFITIYASMHKTESQVLTFGLLASTGGATIPLPIDGTN